MSQDTLYVGVPATLACSVTGTGRGGVFAGQRLSAVRLHRVGTSEDRRPDVFGDRDVFLSNHAGSAGHPHDQNHRLRQRWKRPGHWAVPVHNLTGGVVVSQVQFVQGGSATFNYAQNVVTGLVLPADATPGDAVVLFVLSGGAIAGVSAGFGEVGMFDGGGFE